MGFQLNFFLLKSLLEKTVTQGRAPLQTAGFRRLQTTGRDNKCFFAALSQTLFGSQCWATILKARCLLWIRSLSPSEELLSLWSEGRWTVEDRTQAIIWNLIRLAGGMVEPQDVPIVLAWAFVDLWIDVFLVSNETDFSDPKAEIPCGRDLVNYTNSAHLLRPFWIQDGRQDEGFGCPPPAFPQVLLSHEGAHFEALDPRLLTIRYPFRKHASPSWGCKLLKKGSNSSRLSFHDL